MSNVLLGAFCLFALGHGVVCAQAASEPVRKKGTIFKEEVDGLIDLLTDTARAKAPFALGGDSAAATAKILAAMAKCHRRYYWPGDVPAVSRSVEFLIVNRKDDGSFGDAETTAWVIEALSLLPVDGKAFGDEIARARTWLGKQAGQQAGQQTGQRADDVPGFAARVSKLLEEVRADRFPQHLGADAAAKAAAWVADPNSLAHGAAADTLLQLVVCQAANRALDKAQSSGSNASASGGAQDAKAAADGAWSPAQQKAFGWLLKQQQDGVFSLTFGGKTFPDPAMTAFGAWALQTKGKQQRTADEQATIDKSIAWLLASQNADGTWGQQLPNYTTCVVVGALHKAGDPRAAEVLKKAQQAILGFQNVESTGYQRGDRDYGSIGYGNAQRGDLSNLHFAIEALRQTGLPGDHEALGKALVFLQRTQNLKSVNDFKGKVPDPDRDGVVLDATSGDDGGAVYYPGNSNAGYIAQPDGTSIPRSYGSMTYALLKAYTLAGVAGDDPRVQAAVKWIGENWTLAINPGCDPAMGDKVKYQGLYYYYLVLAQALDAAKVTMVTAAAKSEAAKGEKDEKGAATAAQVDWRKALRAHLESVQQPDGTWVNGKNERWMEGNPLLCTCYAMAALELCR